MTVAVNEPVTHSLTSTGAASYAGILLRIIDAGSIMVFANAIEVAPANFSVSAITLTTFTINLSPVIPAAETILIIQNYPIEREADMSPGQELTSASYNASLDNITLMVKDQGYIQDTTNMRYDIGVSDEVTTAMKAIPIPTGEDNSLVWSTASGFSWSPNHPGGQTVGEYSAEIAAIGGSKLMGHDTGAGGTTVYTQLTTNTAAIATNTSTIVANMATNTAAIGTNATNIAANLTELNTLTDAATSPTANGAGHISYWATDVAPAVAQDLQVALTRALENKLIYASSQPVPLAAALSVNFTTAGVTADDHVQATLTVPPADQSDEHYLVVVGCVAGTGIVTVYFNYPPSAFSATNVNIMVWAH